MTFTSLNKSIITNNRKLLSLIHDMTCIYGFVVISITCNNIWIITGELSSGTVQLKK
jgi:hypothetical protein